MDEDCLIMPPYEYVKAQLRLNPHIRYFELLIALNDGQIYNTVTVNSPTNADNFAAAIRWVKKHKTMREVKEALKNVG